MGHLDCLQLLVPMNKAAIKILVMFLGGIYPYSLAYIPSSSGISGP